MVTAALPQHLQQVGAVTALEQGLGQAFELLVLDPTLAPGHLFGAASLEPLALLEGADIGPASCMESKVPVSSQAMPLPISSTVSAFPADTSD